MDPRLPPQDLEAEMSLLGSMMLDREVVGLVVQIIPREDADRLYRPDHRKLFEALVDIYDSGKAMDVIVVRDELERREILDEVGGIDYLSELVESIPSAAHAEFYARIVRDKSLLRDLIGVTDRIRDDAYESREPVLELLDHAEKRLFEVTEQRVRNQAVALKDIIEHTFQQIETREGHYITGVPSGFLELDDITSGFQPGELIIIAARPSMGKTALGLSLIEHVGIQEGRPAAFFSLEMSRQQIAQRLLCSRGRVDSHRLRRGMFGEQDIESLKAVAGEFADKPVFIDDTPGMTVMETRAKCRRLRMLHGIEIAYVDYLQLMGDPLSARESRQHEIATISRGLKALARELQIPIIAMSQLNRNPEGREGNRPRMSDLRESGAIEQDADVIILLHREEYYLKDRKDEKSREMLEKVKGQAELIIAKQRNGPVGTVTLFFDERSTRFDNLSHVPDPGYQPGEVEYDPS